MILEVRLSSDDDDYPIGHKKSDRVLRSMFTIASIERYQNIPEYIAVAIREMIRKMNEIKQQEEGPQ